MKAVLAKLAAGTDLSADEMHEAVSTIMSGEAGEAQIGAFLGLLAAKGETVDELAAAVSVMREKSVKVDAAGPLVDTCGTGGDGLGLFNISTASSFVVAAGGARVAKHGNRAASGKVGAADALEALGVAIDLDAQRAAQAIEEVGMTFLFAPLYHPAVKHVVGARKELGFRTVFNLTGPLSNPAGATRQVLGVFAEDWLEPIAGVLAKLGAEHALVVHGADGSDEISATGPTTVVEMKDGALSRYEVRPEDFGITPCTLADLDGGEAAESAASIRALLSGEPGPKADAVALNAGGGLYVAGKAASLADGVGAAQSLMQSGEPAKVLDAFVRFTQGGGE